jgi:hypothetical protein
LKTKYHQSEGKNFSHGAIGLSVNSKRRRAPQKKMDFTKLFDVQPSRTDFSTLDGGLLSLMGVAAGVIMSDMISEKAFEKGKASVQQPVEPQAQPQAVNPYRGTQTVGDVEKALLQQPNSHRREYALKELAKYPETMPLNQLPTQSMHLLAGN